MPHGPGLVLSGSPSPCTHTGGPFPACSPHWGAYLSNGSGQEELTCRLLP